MKQGKESLSEKICDVIAYPFSYAYGEIWHTPKSDISEELADLIRTYGLVHFGKSKHMYSMLNNGLLAGKVKPLCPQEKDMVWFYLNMDLQEKWDIIKTKGYRKENDTIYYYDGITDEQIANMKVRLSDNAIVFIGDFSTPNMYAKPINEVLDV